ncbi:MAG TPA: hypothetical protein PKX56_07260 [Marmoricola sp.]|nr:hypothetical protein [Marmoricola sp.]HNN48686.1 hypothetical protein [Marmoricola sp.]
MKISRAEVVDELRDGERCAVMVGNDVIVLSEVPTALLAALAEGPLEVGDLEQRLSEIFGPAPTGAVAEVVTQLEQAGLVTTSN